MRKALRGFESHQRRSNPKFLLGEMALSLDINLGMSLLDYINPFNKVVDRVGDTIDELVVDKDKAIEIKAELEKIKLVGQQKVEESYQIALRTKTHPLLDGAHKMARPVMGMITLFVNKSTVDGWMDAGIEVQSVHVGILALQWGPTGLYTAMKGRGKP